jgi:NAD(P)-dependent dehydrogenase (short-subunit alcohol dehydrogenase family)
MANKTTFITGCSTGLGQAAALLFASKSWRVIATMRRPKRAYSGSGFTRPLAKTPA